MRIILDIPESKAAFFMELIKNFKFVKTKTVSAEKEQLMQEIKEAVDNLNLAKEGKLIARPAKDLLNEL